MSRAPLSIDENHAKNRGSLGKSVPFSQINGVVMMSTRSLYTAPFFSNLSSTISMFPLDDYSFIATILYKISLDAATHALDEKRRHLGK